MPGIRWSTTSSATGSSRSLSCAQGVQGRLAALGAQNPVVLAVLPPQIALDQPQHVRVVIHRQYRRFCRHLCLLDPILDGTLPAPTVLRAA